MLQLLGEPHTMKTIRRLEPGAFDAPKPEAARVILCANHDYRTYIDDCACAAKRERVRYIVIGTAYGYLHTTAGDMRTWNSRSGAAKAAARYADYPA